MSKASRIGINCIMRYGSVRSSKKLILSLFVFGIFLIYGYITYFKEPIYIFVNRDSDKECILPNIDPYDPSISKFYNWHPQPLVCDSTPSLTLVDDSGYLRFNESVYDPSKHSALACAYSIIELVDDFNVKFQPEVPFKLPVDVRSDAFVVKCRNSDGKIIYENIHHKIDRKSVEISRQFKNESDEDFSVYMFGIDSVSRLAAIRKLPKTVQYIKENLGGYVFDGFNKVGDHTFPNYIALLCGELLENMRWIDLDNDYADKFPFIFYDFEKKGYVTMFAEDWPEIATINQVMKSGFKTPPAIHYTRSYWLGMRKVQPLPFVVDQVLMYLESKAMKLRKSSSLCFGNRPNHVLILDQIKQFLQTYKGKRRYFFSWLNEIAHNYVNFLEYGDNDFMELLKWMHKEKHLERAVLLFFSDHGSRVDEIRNTYIGRIEDRMPFVSLVIPEVLKRKYPQIVKTLEQNQKKLTTTLDTYEAIRDVLDKRYTNFNWSVSDKEKTFKKPRSISLFKEIPAFRSCLEAKISDHYCACYSSRPVNINEPILKVVANFVLQNINNILLPVRNICAILKIGAILEARTVANRLERRADKEYRFTLKNWIFSPEQRDDTTYLIYIRTVPGNATFEASVQRSPNGALKIIDDISRTSRYGSQSKCVADRFLKGYCFCV